MSQRTMGRLESSILPVVVIAVVFAANTWLPRSWLIPGLWLAGAVFGAALFYLTAQTLLTFRRLRRVEAVADVSPTRCPACGGTEHDYKSGGLWDGVRRDTGKCVGGSFGYGVCKGCGSRWAQWDDDPPYVPSEAEWDREVADRERQRAEQLSLWTEHHARRTQ